RLRAGACKPAPGAAGVAGGDALSRPLRRRAHRDPPGSSPEAASCRLGRAPPQRAVAAPRLSALDPPPGPPPRHFSLSLGDKGISSRRRVGGSWGQAAISQPRVTLRDHRACARAIACRGTAVEGRPFSTGRLAVTPRPCGVVLALSQVCPQRYPQPVCTDC